MLDGAFLCTQACIPHLEKAGGGTVINIGGLTGHRGATGRAHVIAAKSGLAGLTKAGQKLNASASDEEIVGWIAEKSRIHDSRRVASWGQWLRLNPLNWLRDFDDWLHVRRNRNSGQKP